MAQGNESLQLRRVRFGCPLSTNMHARHSREEDHVEVFFFHLKRFRAIATRYDKTAQNYLALVQLACAWLWLTE